VAYFGVHRSGNALVTGLAQSAHSVRSLKRDETRRLATAGKQITAF
jgi:hypothetical protein